MPLILRIVALLGLVLVAACTKTVVYAPEAEVIAAARTARVDHFVHTLPNGYQTRLGENGVNISAVSRSIMNEVSYKLQKSTGVPVKNVDVYIDTIIG